MVDERGDVVGHEADVYRSIDVSGTAMSLQVDGDDLVALCEHWQNRPEHLARSKPTVQQDQRASGPVGLVVEVDAVDLGVLAAALDGGSPIGLHACTPCLLNGNSCQRSRLRLCLEFIGAATRTHAPTSGGGGRPRAKWSVGLKPVTGTAIRPFPDLHLMGKRGS